MFLFLSDYWISLQKIRNLLEMFCSISGYKVSLKNVTCLTKSNVYSKVSVFSLRNDQIQYDVVLQICAGEETLCSCSSCLSPDGWSVS